MCTAITYHTKDHYFGRNLDLERFLWETVTVTPRHFPFRFRNGETLDSHYAILGMATVSEEYPLYYEGMNEWGLAMAGLNFPGNAKYYPWMPEKNNVAPFELIPWILSQCRDLGEVCDCLNKLNLWQEDFSRELPVSPLHWMVADRERAVTVECTARGLEIFENPVGVLTNNPGFEYHMTHLSDYRSLTPLPPENRFGPVELLRYSRGMGGIGLPGDLSSASRFVRAAFVKLNSRSGEGEAESISQFFHILDAVAQQRGCVQLENGSYEITGYSACMNQDRGIYYYSTYENRCLCAVNMYHCDLDGSRLVTYPMIQEQTIRFQN